MGKRRIMDSKIRTSQNFIKLTYRQRDLWQGIIETADDQGRMPGKATSIRSAVWPDDDITSPEVEADIQVLLDGGFIIRYQVNDAPYIQIVNWWKYQQGQWAGPSDYPPPDSWQDRARYHGKGNKLITLSWELTGGFAEPILYEESGQDRREDSKEDSKPEPPLSRRDVNDDVKASDEDSESKERSRVRTPKPKPTTLEKYFLIKSCLPAPNRSMDIKTRQKQWWTPLDSILSWVNGDELKAEVIIEEAIKKLNNDHMTISDPNSILKTARSIFAEHNHE